MKTHGGQLGAISNLAAADCRQIQRGVHLSSCLQSEAGSIVNTTLTGMWLNPIGTVLGEVLKLHPYPILHRAKHDCARSIGWPVYALLHDRMQKYVNESVIIQRAEPAVRRY